MACSRRRDPQGAFDQAVRTFQHGDIAAATDEAEKGYREFHLMSPEWAWKFRLLQANGLVWRGMNNRVLSLFRLQKHRLYLPAI